MMIGERRVRRNWWLIAGAFAFALLLASRYLADVWIDYQWWGEMRQLDTWFNQILYGTVPVLLVFALLCLVFWTTLKLGLRRRVETPLSAIFRRGLIIKIALGVLAFAAFVVANATVDNWTVVRFLGGMRVAAKAAEYKDPIFGRPLHFYFFTLPFAHMVLTLLVTATVVVLITYALAANAERLANQQQFRQMQMSTFDFEGIHWRDLLDNLFFRLGLALLLAGIGVKTYFDRFNLLLEDHGQYLVGVDWLGDHIVLPLMWAVCAVCLVAALLVLMKRLKSAFALLAVMFVIRFITPAAISSFYVRPNELALEKPYIASHISATRAAFSLRTRLTETTVPAEPEIPLDYAAHKPLLDNVRLWDWRAFHDTISQIQPLRPYAYQDTDVDRYMVDGQIRQVLISPRELDVKQLGSAAARWINLHLIYTHGYGIVMAEANRITTDGLPVLLIKDAPPLVSSASLKFTQPDLYYSEVPHEPVLVNTSQREFDYPSGGDSVETMYKGTGGFSIGSPVTRLAAAVEYGDLNMLLTEYLNSGSRMMIHRSILDRLHKLAGFLHWDTDPYVVLSSSGKLYWIADGYMTSSAHPYSRTLDWDDEGVNYIRNSVKATIDAYTGEVHLYSFDTEDVLLSAYAKLFPHLFEPASRMPADLRAHVRYPEMLFRSQAEIYRSFHMRSAEAFYNRADLWDLAKTSGRGDQSPNYVSPTYVVATLPGSSKPEFLLITTFTPANKDNLIGVMYARCDGEHLGELVFSQLSKQNIVYGPMQIDARINQDQTISKDLSLWNQQGSTVLRGQTLVLPIGNSFLYVEPIYIQSQQASMPQLKKVAIAMGNQLSYADTYEQALRDLIAKTAVRDSGAELPAAVSQMPVSPQNIGSTPAAATPVDTGSAAEKLKEVQQHLDRYRDLTAQGKWSEAGKELEQIQRIVGRNPGR